MSIHTPEFARIKILSPSEAEGRVCCQCNESGKVRYEHLPTGRNYCQQCVIDMLSPGENTEKEKSSNS